MNDLLGRLQRALSRQRAFVGDASHELRTPLAVLRGELELADRPGRSREQLAAAVRSAAAEADRLARITSDLLLLARSDEDRLSLRLEQAELRPLLARSAELAGPRLAQAGLSCRVDAPAGLRARIDPDWISQAVGNLLGNALRFAPRGSVIVLAARASGADLDIEVRDDGPGFPAEFLPHAFERFRRPIPAAPAATAARAWGSPSSRPSPRRTAAWPPRATNRAAGRWSRSTCRTRPAWSIRPARGRHGPRAEGFSC